MRGPANGRRYRTGALWLIGPNPNGPVEIRSPGRWPETVRSAAQASKGGIITATDHPSGVYTIRSPRLIDPNPKGPVEIRSPGRWPETARSAAQASEGGIITATDHPSGVYTIRSPRLIDPKWARKNS